MAKGLQSHVGCSQMKLPWIQAVEVLLPLHEKVLNEGVSGVEDCASR